MNKKQSGKLIKEDFEAEEIILTGLVFDLMVHPYYQ
jgi:hypothetical protein